LAARGRILSPPELRGSSTKGVPTRRAERAIVGGVVEREMPELPVDEADDAAAASLLGEVLEHALHLDEPGDLPARRRSAIEIEDDVGGGHRDRDVDADAARCERAENGATHGDHPSFAAADGVARSVPTTTSTSRAAARARSTRNPQPSAAGCTPLVLTMTTAGA
jgi:hypothetical protein